MKMLVERTPVNPQAEPFDLASVKEHARVTTGDDDAALSNMARAAAAEVEQAAQCALLDQLIRVTVFSPLADPFLMLPIGPLSVGSEPIVTIDGQPFTDFAFASGQRAVILWQSSFSTLTPSMMVIEYQAGFGSSWYDVPSDLQQAVLDQTALHYDGRSPMNPRDFSTSPHMSRIVARYRGVTL
jgi:uncharacterized phiE125 gp8 family phage protein